VLLEIGEGGLELEAFLGLGFRKAREFDETGLAVCQHGLD
jgi:hypothetical protein